MIVTKYFMTRKDGVNLYRTYSDINMKIRQNETNIIYDDAIDPEDSGRTYTETDIPIDEEIEEKD